MALGARHFALLNLPATLEAQNLSSGVCCWSCLLACSGDWLILYSSPFPFPSKLCSLEENVNGRGTLKLELFYRDTMRRQTLCLFQRHGGKQAVT